MNLDYFEHEGNRIPDMLGDVRDREDQYDI